MLRVGILGIGQMGAPIAAALIKAGYAVSVCDIDRERMNALAQAGAIPRGDPGDLAASSDVVITLLTYPKVVEDVLLRAGGVLDGLKRDAILVECSSIDDETARKIAARAKVQGSRFVEAALIGRPVLVERKQLLVLTSGDEQIVEQCRPIFDAFARKVLYAGEFGTVKLLKIANALLNAAEIAVASETLAWSMRQGVSSEAFLGLLSERSPARAKQLGEILGGKLAKQQSWVLKDLYHGLKSAGETETPMPIASAVIAVVTLAKSDNTEGYGLTEMVWKFYERTIKK